MYAFKYGKEECRKGGGELDVTRTHRRAFFIHNLLNGVQRGFQRALMRCNNTCIAVACRHGSYEGRGQTMTY